MMKKHTMLAGAMCLPVFIACVTTSATILDPSAQLYPPVSPDSVRIIVDESELDSLEYVRVAIINAKGSSTYTSTQGMHNAMRKKAGKLGCNAILMPQIKQPGAGAEVAAAVLGTSATRRGEVIGIRIIGPKQQEH